MKVVSAILGSRANKGSIEDKAEISEYKSWFITNFFIIYFNTI